MCLVPDGKQEYRFGLAAHSGGASYCSGRGRAKQAGDMLVLRFDKPSRCIIVAQYDGDRIALAGAVDLECDTLCQERARSEEHTSELQSLMRSSYAVFCLKKKKTK